VSSMVRWAGGALVAMMTLGLAWGEMVDGEPLPTPPADKAARRLWTITGVERGHLPVLKDGPGKGYFAYFKSRLYQAFVDEDGALQVQLLDRNGKEISEVVEVGGPLAGYYTYQDPRNVGRHVPRVMVKTKVDYKPEAQPRDKLILDVILEENVELRRTYEFKADRVIVQTGLNCPNKKKTVARIGVTFPTLMKFKPDVEQEERAKALTGYYLKAKVYTDKRSKLTTFAYAESKFPEGLTDFVEVGGMWGRDRVLQIKSKERVLRPWIYTGYCPYQGYWVYMTVPSDTLKSTDYKFNVEFL
jgi:hypothetical protein